MFPNYILKVVGCFSVISEQTKHLFHRDFKGESKNWYLQSHPNYDKQIALYMCT